jgi:hypothetical protein
MDWISSRSGFEPMVDVVNTVMNLPVLKNVWKFFSNSTTGDFQKGLIAWSYLRKRVACLKII